MVALGDDPAGVLRPCRGSAATSGARCGRCGARSRCRWRSARWSGRCRPAALDARAGRRRARRLAGARRRRRDRRPRAAGARPAARAPGVGRAQPAARRLGQGAGPRRPRRDDLRHRLRSPPGPPRTSARCGSARASPRPATSCASTRSSAARGPNYAAETATSRCCRDGREVGVLAPEKRFFALQRMSTTEAAHRPQARAATSTSRSATRRQGGG